MKMILKIRWNSYGEPASYHSFYNHNGGSRTIDIFYGRYPFIREIVVLDHDSRRIYYFSPGKLTYSISAQVPLNTFDWAISSLRMPVLLESEIMRQSRKMQLYETQYRQSDWKLRAEYNINVFGNLEKLQIDRDFDGVFDEISHFQTTHLYKTIRDENQDGYFELAILYDRKGIPVKYTVDIDGDKHTDFTETRGDVLSRVWHIYDNLTLPLHSHKYDSDKADHIYSYYFKWNNENINIFAPKYLERQK